jgi:cysteine desulfurase / selenocysteine lyase
VIDLEAVRTDTPGCLNRIFLDSAGSSLPPQPVVDEVIGHWRREAEIGGYRAAEERAADLERGYVLLAELLGCEPDEVAFTDSASRSWLAAFDAVPLAPGDRVLISEVEYGANLAAVQRRAELAGTVVDTIPSEPDGTLSVPALRDMLDERVKLVSLVHVPTNSGLVNPVRGVVEAAHQVSALVLLDACQSVGQVPVRVDDLGVDLLSTTGRKWLRGPRGTGALVVRRDVADRLTPRLVDHHGSVWTPPASFRPRTDAKAYELWEFGVAERLGLIAAVRYALDLGIESITKEVVDRADRIRAGLNDLAGVEVQDPGTQRCGLVSFTVSGVDPMLVRDTLRDNDITVTVSPRSSSPLDTDRRGLTEVVRASPHYFVTHEQIDRFLESVDRLRSEP